MQYLSHTEKYKAKMQQMLICPVLRNKALPTQLKFKGERSSYVIIILFIGWGVGERERES